ncbi:MAG: hypothetical protein AABW65_01005 [Nanoarchaeota archaeon]
MESEKNNEETRKKMEYLLEMYNYERVCVVGTTCIGKSNLVSLIKDTYDMDNLVFPLLSHDEEKRVCQTPWTKEIGDTMTRLSRERIKIEAGKPVFGTVVLDSDLIIYLQGSEELLRKNTSLRNKSYEDADSMQKSIGREVLKSGIPHIPFFVG